MLVVNRTERQPRIVIGDGPTKIVVEILEWRDSGVRVGVTAPANISVHREEIYNVIKKHGGDLLARPAMNEGSGTVSPDCQKKPGGKSET